MLLLQTHAVAAARVRVADLRFGIVVIALFLVARLLLGLTLKAAAGSAKLAAMPYQRGQFWARRFRKQTEKVCAFLAALMAPPGAPDFTSRALEMLIRAPPAVAAICIPE